MFALLGGACPRDEVKALNFVAQVLGHDCFEDVLLEFAGRIRETERHLYDRPLLGKVEIDCKRILPTQPLLAVVGTECDTRVLSELGHERERGVVAPSGPFYSLKLRICLGNLAGQPEKGSGTVFRVRGDRGPPLDLM